MDVVHLPYFIFFERAQKVGDYVGSKMDVIESKIAQFRGYKEESKQGNEEQQAKRHRIDDTLSYTAPVLPFDLSHLAALGLNQVSASVSMLASLNGIVKRAIDSTTPTINAEKLRQLYTYRCATSLTLCHISRLDFCDHVTMSASQNLGPKAHAAAPKSWKRNHSILRPTCLACRGMSKH